MTYNHLRAYALILIAFAAQPISGQDFITLQEAVALAIELNYDIQVFENDAEIAKNNAIPGNAGLYPRIDANGNASYSLNNSDVTFSDGTSTNRDGVENTSLGGDVGLTYTLFDGLGNVYAYNQLKELASSADYQTRLNIENTILQVASAYYDVALRTEQIQIVEEALQISRERLTRLDYQYEYGSATRLDRLQAQVDYNTDSTTMINAKLDLRNARRDLNFLLSDYLGESFEIDTTVTYQEDVPLEKILEAAGRNNASLLVASTNVDISEYYLKIARSTQWPVVNVNASYGISKQNFGIGFFQTNRSHGLDLGASVSFNLFNGFVTRTQIQNARVNLESSQVLLDKSKASLNRDVRIAYDIYENSLKVLGIEKTNLATAELNFQRTEEQFRLGTVNNTQFREAQLNMLQARNNISIAKYNAKLAEIELIRLSGEMLNYLK